MKVDISDYPDNDEERKVQVEISDHDLWNLDDTLCLVIAPALRKLKERQSGHPASISFDQWQEILDKIILAFESDRYDYSGHVEDVKERQRKYQEGFELFGKYFQSLWT